VFSIKHNGMTNIYIGPSRFSEMDCASARSRAKRIRERNEQRSLVRKYTDDPDGEATTVSRRVAPVTLVRVRGWWDKGVELELEMGDAEA
jgi:hypothetical protein